MAVQNLDPQFAEAQANVNLGRRRAVAQAAHLEVRAILNRAQPLLDHGLRDVLIGSYARDTGIWPGKDVDIFGKLTLESILSIRPDDAYQLFLGPLEGTYEERVTPQPRSIKIDFGLGDRAPALEFLKARDATRTDAFEFSVDVVPAVRWDERWAIPNNDRKLWLRTTAADRWVLTDPEVLTELTTTRNGDVVIAGQGAFVPTVKGDQADPAPPPRRRPARRPVLRVRTARGFRDRSNHRQLVGRCHRCGAHVPRWPPSSASTSPICDPVSLGLITNLPTPAARYRESDLR